MNRYLLFAGDNYYPAGWNDFVCSSNSIDELIEKVVYEEYNPDEDIEQVKKNPHKQVKMIEKDEQRIARYEALRGRPVNLKVDSSKVDWAEIIDLETEAPCWDLSKTSTDWI